MPRYENTALHAIAFSAFLTSAGGACAASFTFTAINTNGTDLATPEAINSGDQVVGTTTNSQGERVGFVWSAGQLTLVDGSGGLSAINDKGIAVGYPWLGGKNYYVSYDIRRGVLSNIPVNVGVNGLYGATAINASGEVIGVAYGRSLKNVGFIIEDGQPSKLLPPKQKASIPIAVNAKGNVVIEYAGGDTTEYNAYLYEQGTFSNIAVPNAPITNATFITNKNEIGGSFISGNSTSGFLLSHGTYTTYSPAGATSSSVTGVGPSGQVYGTFVDVSGNTHGFVNTNGTFYQIDVPNSTYTNILAVGTSGSIIGLYGTSQGGAYGYIGACPKKDVCTQ